MNSLIKKPKILVVEDEIIVARDIQMQLTELGYLAVGYANTGLEAIDLVRSLKPDLILMDIQLAGEMDGIQAAQNIRMQFSLPVVFLTAFAADDILARAKLTEPFGYVLKPFSERELRTVIEMALYRHEADLKLRRSEENLSITLQSIGDGVIATDAQGLVTRMNPTAERLTGWRLDEALGKPLTEVFNIVNERTRIKSVNPVQLVMQHGKVVGLANHTILIAQNGKREYHIFDSAAPIRDTSGKIVGVVLVFSDVTERSHLEDQLRESQKMQAIGTLAGGIAHDFNNILAVILGNTELAQECSKGNVPALENLDEIMKAGIRARDLVRQILSFSRRQPTDRKPISLIPIIEESARLLRSTFPPQYKLNVDYDHASPTVLADVTQIQQVILNLATNAMQAMESSKHARGEIGILLQPVTLNEALVEKYPKLTSMHNAKPGQAIRLSVVDNGPGMDAETLERIFEPFFTTKLVDKGTGLGLSVVHGIVHTHEGAIVVESKVGEGTTFSLFLHPA